MVFVLKALPAEAPLQLILGEMISDEQDEVIRSLAIGQRRVRRHRQRGETAGHRAARKHSADTLYREVIEALRAGRDLGVTD